jgi:hypothetical protein
LTFTVLNALLVRCPKEAKRATIAYRLIER